MIQMPVIFSQRLKEFYRSEDGVAVVEFVLSVPLMIVLFAVIVEMGRLFLGYQSTVTGVREASRYLARIAPIDICSSGGSLSSYNTMLKNRIENNRASNSVLPSQFSVTSVSATFVCVSGSYRTSPAPVATVSASIDVQFPFGTLFGFLGTDMTSLQTSVSNSTRIFGQ